MAVTAQPFGTTSDGQAVTRYILRNSLGMQAAVLSYGAVVQSILVPDKNGVTRDVVLGYDDISDYEKTFAFSERSSADTQTASKTGNFR